MGGETPLVTIEDVHDVGLSPRGRGNRVRDVAGLLRSGSIPAWAGKPTATPCPPRQSEVYPRVGGETICSSLASGGMQGLSPRGRGNHGAAASRWSARWSIPAWAGKPTDPRNVGQSVRVYPRVGGETSPSRFAMSRGSGLSPRGRGNPAGMQANTPPLWSIPAWAGKPGRADKPVRLRWVYPRVGGETWEQIPGETPKQGLSPRGRGNLGNVHATPLLVGSIPAWAGKPRAPGIPCGMRRVYPRVGGETVVDVMEPFREGGLSPRGRGNLRNIHRIALEIRSIPAWAGKPSVLPSATAR